MRSTYFHDKSSKIKAISMIAFFILNPLTLKAENADNRTTDHLDPHSKTLVITANRTTQNIDDTLAAVELITREDIERLQPESLVDLLVTVAGFDIARSGGAGQTASLFARGSSSDHTLVLIDGIRVGSATLGNKAFATIPMAQIERIEIVKGPRASLWGSDAIGGVIQIFTRRLNEGEYSLGVSLGSDSYKSANLSTGFGSNNINNTFTVSYEKSDGFDVFDDSVIGTPDSEPDNDGYQRISAAIRGDYRLSNETALDWVFQLDDGENSFDNSFGANENEYSNHLWNIRYLHSVDAWQSEFSVKQSRDKAFSYDSRTANKVGSVFETRRSQINALTQYTHSETVKVSAGIERYTDDISGSQSLQFDGSFANFDETERSSSAVFLSSVMNFDQFVGEVSTRYDDIDTVGSEQTFNVSAGYKIFDNVTFAASRSKGFKAPTFNDQYFPGFSNPDLVSEVSYNTEFLIRANWGNQTLMVLNYDNQVDRLITFVFDPVTFAFLPFNLDTANLKGHEVVYNYRQDNMSHKLTASFVDAIDTSIDAFTGEAKNEQLLRRAKEHYGYELTAEFGELSLFGQFNYIGRRRDNNFSTFPATPVYLKSHININIGGTYHLSDKMSVKFRVSDVADAEEPTVFNYNAAGRQAFLSLHYQNF